jgi:hypothetical protein
VSANHRGNRISHQLVDFHPPKNQQPVVDLP